MKKLLFLLVLGKVCLSAQVFAQSNSKIPNPVLESHKLDMGYVNSLSNKANFFLAAQNYEEAIRIGKERLLILEHLLGQASLEYAEAEAELALYIANTGNYKESITLAENALNKIEKTEGKISALYAVTVDKLSTYYSLLGDHDNALKYGLQAVSFLKDVFGIDSDFYISSKSTLASTYTKLHRIQDAIEIQKECNEFYINKGDSVKYAIGLHDLSLSYAASGDYSKAINYCDTSSKLLLLHLGQGDLLYRETLKTLADYYVEIGDFNNVHIVSDTHVQLCKQYCGENSHDYIRALSNQAFYYGMEGNYKKAIELEENVLSLQEKGTILDSLDYAITLSSLAMFNMELGFIEKAITWDEQALCILNDYPATKAYRCVLSDLSSCHMLLGDFEKAITLINMVLSALKDRKGSEYYGYLANLANCYYSMNQMPQAINIYTEVLQNQELLIGKNNLNYASTLENLASCYSAVEHYRDAITAQNECAEIRLKILGEENTKYAFSLLKLGYYYRCIGEDKKSLELQEKAIGSLNGISESGVRYIDAINQLVVGYRDSEPEYALKMAEEAYKLLKENFSKITSTHIRCLSNLAGIYISLGQFDNAKKICYTDFEKADVHDYLMKNMDDYVSCLHTKARLNFAMQDYANAVITEKEALEIRKSIDNKVDELSIINLLLCYLALNDTTNAIGIVKDNNLIENTRKIINLNINSLTSKSRFSYWNRLSKLYTDLLPLLAVVSKDSTLICQTYDNSALFAKSLLLRNDIRVSEIIRSTNDESLKMKYKKFQDHLSSINNSLQDSIIRAALLKTNMALEDEIRQQLLSSRLITDVSVTWKDVQRCLKQNDVAIEFLSIQLEDNREGYIALVNKKDFAYPHLYILSEREEIVAANNRGPSALFNLIWSPLKDELENVKNIFFTPAGELYNLGIEYLNDSTGYYLLDNYAIYRLSSTQELLNSHPFKSLQSAVLYGGLDYFSSHSALLKEKVPDKTISYGSLMRSINERGGFEPLYGTSTEIKDISELLQKGNLICKIYTGNDGTESSFKSIVNTQPDILHIATHGMYIKLDEKKDLIKKNNFSFVLSEDDDNLHPEDISLTRSFIVMSGGNQLIQRDSIPLDSEDGIVTAEEISHMDLHETNLVVLSACQTGLGDVSNEGVYGLQRGFKKAGANTLLMSLDKVDDEATRTLMVEFYRNLLNGKTKHQSLKEAQKHLRSVENGKYDDPKYWASFIMLDGLN